MVTLSPTQYFPGRTFSFVSRNLASNASNPWVMYRRANSSISVLSFPTICSTKLEFCIGWISHAISLQISRTSARCFGSAGRQGRSRYVSSIYSRMARLWESTWPSDVIKTGTFPLGLSLRWSSLRWYKPWVTKLSRKLGFFCGHVHTSMGWPRNTHNRCFSKQGCNAHATQQKIRHSRIRSVFANNGLCR